MLPGDMTVCSGVTRVGAGRGLSIMEEGARGDQSATAARGRDCVGPLPRLLATVVVEEAGRSSC